MDDGPYRAIKAILRGLYKSGAVTAPQAEAAASELRAEVEAIRDYNWLDKEEQLNRLADELDRLSGAKR